MIMRFYSNQIANYFPCRWVASCSIVARGKPGRRSWEAEIVWGISDKKDHGRATTSATRLTNLFDQIGWYERMLKELDVMKPSGHILVFAPLLLKSSILRVLKEQHLLGTSVEPGESEYLPTQHRRHLQFS